MPTETKFLEIEDVERIVKQLVHGSEAYAELDDKSKALVTLGTTLRKERARCMAYIAGERPELGTIIAVFDVDRKTGEAVEISSENW